MLLMKARTHLISSKSFKKILGQKSPSVLLMTITEVNRRIWKTIKFSMKVDHITSIMEPIQAALMNPLPLNIEDLGKTPLI